MLDTEAASFILFCFISKHTCLGLACIVSRAQCLYNSGRLGSCWSPSRNRITPSRKLANSLSSSAIPQNPPRRQLIDQSPRTAWEKRHECLRHHAERRMSPIKERKRETTQWTKARYARGISSQATYQWKSHLGQCKALVVQ